MNTKLSLYFLLILFFSCKTQEQIRQEQLVNNLDSVVKGQSKVSAETVSRISALEEATAKISGQLEGQNYNIKNTLNQRVEELNQRIKLLEESQELTLDRMKQQEKYLKKLLSTLGGDSKKKKSPPTYQRAMINYQKKYYKSAKKYLLILFEDKSVKGSKRARVIHHLGMIEYRQKDNQKALFYFSKLYNLYPKSSFNKEGLLHLAKTFQRMKKSTEARSTLEELIRQFPSSKEAGQAKTLLSKI